LISGDVPAAILVLVSAEAAEGLSRNRRLQDISNPALASFIEGTTRYTMTKSAIRQSNA
jgi:hypothetical protein